MVSEKLLNKSPLMRSESQKLSQQPPCPGLRVYGVTSMQQHAAGIEQKCSGQTDRREESHRKDPTLMVTRAGRS